MRLWCLSCVILVVAACQPEPPAETPSAGISEEERQRMGVTNDQARKIAEERAKQLQSAELDAEQQAALDLAMEALSRKVDLTGMEISHKRVQATEWPSSALGCPEPGTSYLDMIVPGFLVSLSADGKPYTVHVGGGRAVVCDRIMEELEARRAKGQAVMNVYQAARVDLAGRLKIDPAEVKVTSMKSETWEDSSMGCPAEGREYEQGAVEGFVINLECRGRKYEYRTDKAGTEFVACGDVPSCHETE